MFSTPSHSSDGPDGPDAPDMLIQTPIGLKIFMGCFLTPFVAIGIGLILLIFGVFPEFGQIPPAFLIPFAIVWNGIVGLFLYVVFIRKANFYGQMGRFQRRFSASGQWSQSSKGNLDSYPPDSTTINTSGYSSESREETYASSMPPRIPQRNLRLGRILALVMPLGIIVYLIIDLIYPMIEDAGGSIEQAYANNGIMLLLLAGVVVSLILIIFRSLKTMQSVSENASSL